MLNDHFYTGEEHTHADWLKSTYMYIYVNTICFTLMHPIVFIREPVREQSWGLNVVQHA